MTFVRVGSVNFGNVDTYLDYKCRYRATLGAPASLQEQSEKRVRNRIWNDNDVTDLVSMRCQPNPPTYSNIAFAFNRSNARLGIKNRPFTAKCCNNKWFSMFPASQDVNRAVQYVRDLQQLWPELYFRTETEIADDLEGPAKLLALHIVWPWSKDFMTRLAPSVFCDATFKVTVYCYKVVCITCLDGNNQHRPLMCSFIMDSTATQWSTIFDIFNTK